MSRLQKKCLIASATMHSLLLGLLAVSPALVPSSQEPDLPLLTFIPTKLTDEPFSGGGGSPNAATPAAPPAAQNPPPRAEIIPPREPDPVQPQPDPPRKAEPKITPPKVTPKPSLDSTSKRKTPSETPAKKPHEIKPTFKKSSDNSQSLAAAKAKAKAQAEADARALARYAENVNRQIARLQSGLSGGTDVSLPLGPGGEAYANYSQVVKSMYANAWFPPEELADDSATVKAEVVILRDGRVKSARITKPSGIPALDATVRRALELKSIAPFPSEAKDTERTFIINFDPKIKRPFG